MVKIPLGGDEGKITLRTQAGGWRVADRWRGSFIAGLTARFRRGRGESGEERQLGGIILREVTLEPVAADPGVLLLTKDDLAEAAAIASRCRELNESRKAIQQSIVAQGVAQGRKLLEKHPTLSLLVLAHPDWLPGVVGPAASRIAGQLERSAILLGLDKDPGKWKGSGRSFRADNLGAWLRNVKQQGLVERAGGHAAAAGVSLRTEQICQLCSAAKELPMPQVDGYEPGYEVIGELVELRANEWMQVIEALGPFGSGNPVPATQAKQNFRGARRYSRPVDKTAGLCFDQTVGLTKP